MFINSSFLSWCLLLLCNYLYLFFHLKDLLLEFVKYNLVYMYVCKKPAIHVRINSHQVRHLPTILLLSIMPFIKSIASVPINRK